MNLRTILEQAIEEKASDVFIVSGLPVSFRKDGVIKRVNEERLLPPDTESLLTEIYQHAGERDLRILVIQKDAVDEACRRIRPGKIGFYTHRL